MSPGGGKKDRKDVGKLFGGGRGGFLWDWLSWKGLWDICAEMLAGRWLCGFGSGEMWEGERAQDRVREG